MTGEAEHAQQPDRFEDPSGSGARAGGTLVLSSTFPQHEGDPRGAFILRHWERRDEQGHGPVSALVPRTAWSRGDLVSRVRVERFDYAPRRLSTLTGHFGILENVRECWWRALLIPVFWRAQTRALRRVLDGPVPPTRVAAHMFLPCGWIAARECDARGVPYELFGHGTDVDLVVRMPKFIRAGFLARLQKARAVYLPSQNKLQRLLEAMELEGTPAHFRVQTMIESVPFPSVPRVRREPTSVPQLLFVGRLIRQKGVDLMLEAASVLGRDVRVDVAGEGPERRKLESLARRLGLDAHFHGFMERPQLEHLYARADLVCVPSREWAGLSEGAPLVIPEALAFGLPVVACRVGGIPELCEGEPSCVLSPPEDHVALADAIRRALARATDSPSDEAAPGQSLGARHVA